MSVRCPQPDIVSKFTSTVSNFRAIGFLPKPLYEFVISTRQVYYSLVKIFIWFFENSESSWIYVFVYLCQLEADGIPNYVRKIWAVASTKIIM